MVEVLCNGVLLSSFKWGSLKLAMVGYLLHGNLQMLQIGAPPPHPVPVAKYLPGHHCLSLSPIGPCGEEMGFSGGLANTDTLSDVPMDGAPNFSRQRLVEGV